ncbi:P-loop containing nucleoside triphosphate hydrolase protein [Fistulina hepatica ATCC 64428]|uniref:p-loop containing nucleoside triphosphate hydrolase protein n=1 Tax=Fistulina hepatica ATCC 64428 TaxID=1128425 RepID=A0A0D7A3N5_9AGAR|nr:P-loop containing nucleoside triphosphate hydrolase protein [Fistulina hepatica ATCC 64428]
MWSQRAQTIVSRESRNTVHQLNRKCSNSLGDSNLFAYPGSAAFLAGATSDSSIPSLHGLPEIYGSKGRANCGKSSLFNAVLGRNDLLHTSKRAGHTRQLNFYRVGREPGKLVLVDAPGYGARGRPEWGELFNYYISTRKQLRCIYILFNAKNGLNEFDKMMLQKLSQLSSASDGPRLFALQSIITKADCLPSGREQDVVDLIRYDIQEAAPTCLPPIITSALMKPAFGIQDVRASIQRHCGY